MAGAGKGVMNGMESTDIVIHKGENEERYQLYVEDYVISYLKNYRTADDGNIFFYGRKELQDKKYYIYGAGWQEQIPYFAEYMPLHEISCRYEMDMPVFSVREDEGNYELAGYYIFYHSNEAMQSYMIEQRKQMQSEGKNQDKAETKAQERSRQIEDVQKKNREQHASGTRFSEKSPRKSRGGLMAAQLAAIFVILAAIIINSTNSYTELQDLNQAAVEVFFAMENEEAADIRGEEDIAEGITLRLEDIDAKFEEENQTVQKEQAKENQEVQKEEEQAVQKEGAEENQAVQKEDATEENVKENNDEEENRDKDKETIEKDQNDNEEQEAEQAFARNFAEYYQIEKGDTLCTISIKLYGDASKVNEICELNKISDPDHIRYGQKILLP